MIILLYFAIAFVMIYSEATNCYRCKVKFDFKRCLIFSLFWVISIPYAVYLVWKEGVE